MVANATTIQEKTAKMCKPNAEKPSESVFIGLVRTDDSAGK